MALNTQKTPKSGASAVTSPLGPVEKAKGFLATPKGKAIGAIAAVATLGAAAMLIRRARRLH
jgi:hypothetical protein